MLKKLKQHSRLILLGAGFAIFYFVLYLILRNYRISKEEIQRLLAPFGVYGILALLFLQIIFSLTPIPDSAMPLIATITYGPAGVIVVMVGMFIAALIHYLIGHRLGKALITKKFPETKRYLEKLSGKHVIPKLVAMRLFTLVSFDITSYIAGISDIDFKTFFIATAIGLIPTNLIMLLIGLGLFAQTQSDIILTWGVLIIVAILLFLFYKKSAVK